jgi:zinc/manganese transport system substrate-binding protein
VLASCSTGSNRAASGSKLTIVVAENFWGSIVTQLAGDQAQVTSIIVNPATDPHDYESTAADGREIASANYVVYDGLGYDAWVSKTLATGGPRGRLTLNVGDLLGLHIGDNPHQWYSPTSVNTFIGRVTADLERLDPKHASYFSARRIAYETTGLRDYHNLIATIAHRYAGVPVGASESIFSPLAAALHLDLRTPKSLVDAIAEGTEPTAKDKAVVDEQIATHEIKVFVFNTQNATPDVQRLVDEARREDIPIATVTETLSPANLTFQAWQVRQLTGLQHALAQATGH